MFKMCFIIIILNKKEVKPYGKLKFNGNRTIKQC